MTFAYFELILGKWKWDIKSSGEKSGFGVLLR